MQVAVIGAGHVGLVTAACLARIGHDVVANDDDLAKLEQLAAGRPWFHEPGLPELLDETIAAGRLRFTADKGKAVRHGEVIFICVGTPSRPDGSPNLAIVEAVAREVAQTLPAGSFRLVCEKSTVPVQTGDRVAQVLAREGTPEAAYEVASNPSSPARARPSTTPSTPTGSWSGPRPSAGRPCWPSCTGRSWRRPGASCWPPTGSPPS